MFSWFLLLLLCFLLNFYFLHLSFMAFSKMIHLHVEPIVKQSWAKTGATGKKQPDLPAFTQVRRHGLNRKRWET